MAKLTPFVVWNLVKELKVAAEDARPLQVSGALASQLAKELGAGAQPGAVRVGGQVEDAGVLVRVLGGAPTEEDERELRAAKRARVPVVAVQTGTAFFDVPYVLATDVVPCRPGEGFPVAEIADAVAARLGEGGTGLAARVPLLREPVCRQLIETFSRQNGVVGAAFGFRAVARQLLGAVPVAGRVVKGGIAYSGTRALGEAAMRYFQAVSEPAASA